MTVLGLARLICDPCLARDPDTEPGFAGLRPKERGAYRLTECELIAEGEDVSVRCLLCGWTTALGPVLASGYGVGWVVRTLSEHAAVSA